MSTLFLEYLERELARLDHLIGGMGHHAPDRGEYERLLRQRRMVVDQLAQWEADTAFAEAA